MNNLPSNWELYEGVLTRFPKDFTVPANQAIVMLHGAGLDRTEGGAEVHAEHIEETGQYLLDHADANNIVLVLPESGVIAPNGVSQQTWDWSGHFDSGQDMVNIIEVIKLLRGAMGIDTVWLHGGSGGGIMAWRVAVELERASLRDLIYGLICTECISPFSLSIDTLPPPAYKRLLTSKQFSFGGFDFYHSSDIGSYTPQLGLPNEHANWAKQMLYQWSPDDPIILLEWKQDFAEALRTKATALTVKSSGSGHDLGPCGWIDLVNWMQDKT